LELLNYEFTTFLDLCACSFVWVVVTKFDTRSDFVDGVEHGAAFGWFGDNVGAGLLGDVFERPGWRGDDQFHVAGDAGSFRQWDRAAYESGDR
jgi:hypothetical protein